MTAANGLYSSNVGEGIGEEEGEMGRVEREIPGPMELCHEKDGKK